MPLDALERSLCDEVAAREDELVALAADLIRFATTAGGRAGEEPPLQSMLGARLAAVGMEVDVWVPDAADVAGAGQIPAAFTFDGRPQLVARRPQLVGPGGAVNAIAKAALLLDAVVALDRRWSTQRHPSLSPGHVIPTLARGGDWDVNVPARCAFTLHVAHLPSELEAAREVEAALHEAAAGDPWLAAHPPAPRWLRAIPACEIDVRRPVVGTALGAAADVGRPGRPNGLDSWRDGATLTLRGDAGDRPRPALDPRRPHRRRARRGRRPRRVRAALRGRGEALLRGGRRLAERGKPGLGAHLAEDPLQARLGRRVHVAHGAGDHRVHRRDLAVHLVRDAAVGRMPFASRAQLDELEGLAGVEVEDVADAEAEAQRVDGLALVPGRDEPRVLGLGDLERPAVGVAAARGVDLLGDAGAEVGRQALPLHGEHPVALQVAERAVVRDDLEAVAQRLEAAPGPVAAVGPLADEVAQQRGALVAAERRESQPRLLLGAACRLEEQRREQRLLVAVDVQQPDGRAVGRVAAWAVEAESRGPACARGVALAQVADPLAPALGPLDARDEARHDGLDGTQDPLAAGAGLGQRVREQVEDELLVGLAGRVDAHVRQRRRGQQPAQEVERLRLDRAVACRAPIALERRVDPGDHAGQRRGVRAKQRVHGPLVLGAQRGVAPVPVAASGHRGVVGDVARGLLEVRAQPRTLEDLGQDVGDPLAGDVRAAELRDRVVAVAHEDPLVERRGARALAAVERVAGIRDRVGELVEEEPPQRPRVARVAGEQRALHGLRQADEREHRSVGGGEVPGQAGALRGGEVLVGQGRKSTGRDDGPVEVRVELHLAGDGDVAVQMTRDEAGALELAEGDVVWVAPGRAPVFSA